MSLASSALQTTSRKMTWKRRDNATLFLSAGKVEPVFAVYNMHLLCVLMIYCTICTDTAATPATNPAPALLSWAFSLAFTSRPELLWCGEITNIHRKVNTAEQAGDWAASHVCRYTRRGEEQGGGRERERGVWNNKHTENLVGFL